MSCQHPSYHCTEETCRHHVVEGGKYNSVSAIAHRQRVQEGETPACALWSAQVNGEMTLEQVGAILGITRERVRQIEEKALWKLATNPVTREKLGVTLTQQEALDKLLSRHRRFSTYKKRADSSMGEQGPYKALVAGSNPVPPIKCPECKRPWKIGRRDWRHCECGCFWQNGKVKER